MEMKDKNRPAAKEDKTRKPYEKPTVLYEGELETMAAVCDSAFAGFGNCRTSGIPTCIRLTT